MRWEDERYVRVYTRDTGDWLALSFRAQALFLMLLRKVDRIGELRLGRRGKGAIAALLGHPAEDLHAALEELLADGCVCLDEAGETLFVPNFLKAQETPKTPAERKREQRERDARDAADRSHAMSRESRERVTGHEMSPRAVPNHAVPSEPPVLDPPATNPVSAMGATPSPASITNGAVEDRRKEDVGPPRGQERRGVPLVEPPDTPPHTWSGVDFWRWFQGRRQASGYVPEEMPRIEGLNRWWSEARMTVSDVERLKEAVYAFGDAKFWERRNVPWNGFQSKWREFVPREERRGTGT